MYQARKPAATTSKTRSTGNNQAGAVRCRACGAGAIWTVSFTSGIEGSRSGDGVNTGCLDFPFCGDYRTIIKRDGPRTAWPGHDTRWRDPALGKQGRWTGDAQSERQGVAYRCEY